MEPFNSKQPPKGADLKDNIDVDSNCSSKDPPLTGEHSPLLSPQHAPSLIQALPNEGAKHSPDTPTASRTQHPTSPPRATPTAAQTTPNINLATSINLSRSSLNSVGSATTFHSLQKRHTALDPFLTLPLLKRRAYSSPSMVQRLTLEKRLKEHSGCVNCINFSWGGKLLASGSDDLQVVLWDWTRGKAVSRFDSGHVANVFQAKFMPHCDDSVLVTAARDGQVMCDVITQSGALHHSKRVGHHNDSAHKLSIEPESPHVFLSCGEDGSVLQIDLREDDTRNKILICKNEKNRRISLYSIFIDPSNLNYFAVSGRDQWARIYDRRLLREECTNGKYEAVKQYCPHHLMRPDNEVKRANITCLVYSHDGRQLLTSYNDEDIYLFDTSHSSEADHIRKYAGHRNSATVKGVSFFGMESEYVTSGSDCGNVFLWDKDTEEIVQYMEGDFEGVVNCLEPHPYMPVLATSGLDHDVKIFSPTAVSPTTLDGLSEVTSKNKHNREEAWNGSPADGYEVVMEFIMRQYRRGLRERVGIQDEESDDSAMDTPPNEGNEEDEGEGRIRRCIQQ